MRKLVIFMMVVVIALTLMGGLALAGGWTSIDYVATHAPDGNGGPTNDAVWNPTTGGSPHGFFSATSNKCRVCHAVHEANSDSWRLLKATDKVSECDVCHGTTGLTLKRPYGTKTYTIRGEHTLTSGAIDIPDSTVTTSLANGLGCNNCHSVHGAKTLATLNATTTNWNTMILRYDPNSDTNILAKGSAGVVGDGTSTPNEIKTGFCADCHNKNPNWNAADTTPRANGTSHVQGPAADGSLEVNSVTTTVAYVTADTGCRSCHSASDVGNLWGIGDTSTSLNAFPHQTGSDKLLADSIQNGGVATAVNDANRVIPAMDEVCGTCHTNSGDFGTATGGVGIDF